MCAVGILGGAGNVFVIVVILGSASMRKRNTNILILLQSVIDLINSVLVILNNVIEDRLDNVSSGLGSEIFCRLWLLRSPSWGFMTMSSYNLVAIGLERYIAIVHPLKYNKDMVQRRLGWIIFAEIVLGFFAQYALIIPTSTIKNGVCSYMGQVTSWSTAVLLLVGVTLNQFFIPLFILIYLYSHMAIVLGRQKLGTTSASTHDNTGGALREQRMKQAQMNLLQICVIVTVLFVVCIFPSSFYFYVYRVGRYS